jgi:Cu(I)/Ag(I) efflux system membrane fusion protein
MKAHKNKSIWFWITGLALVFLAFGCNNKAAKDIPAKTAITQLYRCPMHHEIVREEPGTCPICGMDLVAFGSEEKPIADVSLNTLLKPTNSYVISTIPIVSMEQKDEPIEIEALGTIQYDTREAAVISARVSGRIEKLYVKYTFQDIKKGQKLMEIYSPELLTAQQDLLFLLRNDPGNSSMINAARERLLLLGMSGTQLQQVIQSQKAALAVSIYSNFNGHIHDALNMTPGITALPGESLVTRELALKEGMHVQKGQALLSVLNPHRLWAVLNIYAGNQNQVKQGNMVRIRAEAKPEKIFNAKIDFIEPFYREGSKTSTARVYLENNSMNLPVGSQVKASIISNTGSVNWLPGDAVISLGINKLVFKKSGTIFKAHKVETGIKFHGSIQILDGLAAQDEVAANAQFLVDSESFIKLNE